MTDPVLDPRSSSAIMDLVLPLSLSHPSILALLDLKPLSRPSVVSHSHLTKFVGRVNVAVLGREGEGGSKTGSEVARRLVEDDEEGWVMSEYGKGWVTICLTELAVSSSHALSPSAMGYEQEYPLTEVGELYDNTDPQIGANEDSDHAISPVPVFRT